MHIVAQEAPTLHDRVLQAAPALHDRYIVSATEIQGHSFPTKCVLETHRHKVKSETMPHSRSEQVCDKLTRVIDPAGPTYSKYSCFKHSTAMQTHGLAQVIILDRCMPTAIIVAHGKRAATLCKRKV